MTLPQFGQNIARIDIELADILDLEIVAPAAGDILIYDGDSWDNQPVTGDITITAGGVTAISPGVIVDADISATAEIAVSKLADGAARQVLQTDAAGTGVEWTDNVDLPGTLDVTLLATFDTAITLGEGAAQAGTDVYLARDNDGDLTLNALVGKTINLAIAGADEYVFSASALDMNSNTITEIGNAGSQLLADAWTMLSANAQNFLVETTGVAVGSEFTLKIPASGSSVARLNFVQGSGSGAANNMKYTIFYDGTLGQLLVDSRDIDGVSGDGNIFTVDDGTDDVKFFGGISTDSLAAPIAGMNIGAHALFNTSVDSALVADQVGFGRFEIGAGNTVIALSQETAVVAAIDESDFSHAMQVRINGVSYFFMLASSLS